MSGSKSWRRMARAESSTCVHVMSTGLLDTSGRSVVWIFVYSALELFKELVDV